MVKRRLILLPERFNDEMQVRPQRERLILPNPQPEIAPRRRLILEAAPAKAPALPPPPAARKRLIMERKRLHSRAPDLTCVVATSQYFADLGKMSDKAVFEVASAVGCFGSRLQQQQQLCTFLMHARPDVVEKLFMALSIAALRCGHGHCVRMTPQ